MAYLIREINESDNSKVEKIIRECLIEYGANHDGTAWADPDLGCFFQVYQPDNRRYFVAEDQEGKVVGGVGIGELEGVCGVCELQKMYCLPEARGTGCAQMLLDAAIDFAKDLYDSCYLETLPNMTRANKFYQKNGFILLDKPLGKTTHFACDVVYIKKLKGEK